MKYNFLFIVIIPLLILSGNIFSQEMNEDETYQSYLAHITAANLSLKFNDAREAERWLKSTPERYRGWEWNYLVNKIDQSLSTIKFDKTIPLEAHFSPDKKNICVGLEDGSVAIVETEQFKETKKLIGHQSTVYTAKYTPDSKKIVSCSRDSTIILWDVPSGKILWQVKAGGYGLADVDISPDGKTIAYCSWQRNKIKGVYGIISLWSLEAGELIWETEFDSKPNVAIRFSPNGEYFAVGTWGWRVGIWKTQYHTGPIVFNYDDVPSYSAIDEIEFSPDSKYIAAVSKSSIPRIWNVESGELATELHGHTKPVFGLEFNLSGEYIYTSGSDAALISWNTKSGQMINKLFGHTDKVTSIDINKEGTLLVTASSDSTIKLWDANLGFEFTDPKGRSYYIYAFDINPDGKTLAAQGPNNTISIWNLDSGKLLKNFEGLDELMNCITYSPDGKYLAGGNWGTEFKIWDAETGKAKQNLKGMEGGTTSCMYSPDGKIIASVSTEKALLFWSSKNGELIKKIPTESVPYAIRFNNPGTMIASGDVSGVLNIWDAADFSKIFSIDLKGGKITYIDFHPWLNIIAAACSDNTIHIFDLNTKQTIKKLKGHTQSIWTVEFSPDGERLVTGSADNTLRLWDTKIWETVLIVSEFSNPVYNAIFTLEGYKLIANSAGQEIKVLNAKTK